MTTPLLKLALEPVLARQRRASRLRLAGWTLLAATAARAALVAMGYRSWLGIIAVLLVANFIRRAIENRVADSEPDFTDLARRIEAEHPDLHAVLLTAVEQRPDRATGRFNVLQQRVIADAIAESRKRNWVRAVPAWHVGASGMVLAVGVAAFCWMLAWRSDVRKISSRHTASAAPAKGDVEVTPGDVELEKGSGLIVLARFGREIPTEAVLVVEQANQPQQRIALVKNLADPVFGGGVPSVENAFSYRVEYTGKATRDFRVTVFEHPDLDRADATLRFPAYTGLGEKALPDTRRVTAVVGTALDVAFHLNKPVKSATLVAKDGKETPLESSPDHPLANLRNYIIAESQTFELRLVDADGRKPKVPILFSIEAQQNRVPELKIAAPKGDQRVSPIEEVGFSADAWDDFGISRAGLTYRIGTSEPVDVELAKDIKADERRSLSHLLQLETADAKPDELVSWFLWAEDIGPDGKPRRTATDMYFAEVRPFEEIFRQGDQQESEQQRQQRQRGPGGEAARLAETQKQIISATWNLKRAEDTAPKSPTQKYLSDEPVVRGSQANVLEQTKALAEKLENPKTRGFADTAIAEMTTAHDHLEKASKDNTPLPEALKAEQEAYNALLKLAAHEFRITRQQNQSGEQSNQQRQMQAQLDQLEMKDEKKRYENKSEAEQPQETQQREQVAVLNRLKELAQRQQDINERLKEIEAQLQAAKTPKEEEELKRELKRLREEQQELLADLDETQQKMEQSNQRSEMAEERKQLEQTRNEAQQASEQMQRGEASKALASGTRAQNDLQKMTDDLRKKTSAQFRDEMREMRSDARDLAQKQQEISEQLASKDAAPRPERRTLDGSGEREQLSQQLDDQQKKLTDVSEQMKRVSQEAEASEPLLSRELYDTLRRTTQAGTDDSLRKTRLAAEHGLEQQARQFEQKARGDIEQLKEGVEKAAESVLGDETEALRQARAELDTLRKEIEREIAQNTGQQPADESQQGSAPDNQAGDSNKGQNGQTPERRQPGDQRQTAQNGQQDGQNRESQQEGTSAQPQGDQQNGERNGQQTAQAGQQPGSQRGQRPGQGQQQENGQRDGQQTAQNGQQPGSSQGQQPGSSQGQQPGSSQGQQPGKDQQPGAGQQTAQNGQQPGSQRGQRPGDQQSGNGQRNGQQTTQNGRQPGSPQEQQPGEGQQTAQSGQQPGSQRGQRPGQGRQQGTGQTAQNGQQQGSQRGQQPGQGQQGGQENGQQPGNQQDQANSERQGSQTAQNGGNADGRGGAPNSQRRPGGLRDLAQQPRGPRIGSNDRGGRSGGPADGEQAGPLTGEDFSKWADRLRNVEEMVDDPAVRAEAARVREIARGMRVEFKRHSLAPKWDAVRAQISAPLAELRDRVAEELARRESKENLVPIDRDPVPQKYAERVRRYYEDLGRSK